MSQDGDELNITVAVRCRGRNDREIKAKSAIIVTVPDTSGSNQVKINTTGETGITAELNSKTYHVDKVFGPSATQLHLFQDVAEPLFHDFIKGYNCTMLVYGMTSTGKTYTMTGDENLYNCELSEEAGIIPRVLFKLFETLKATNNDYVVKCSFIELYNEELNDLLDDTASPDFKKLRIFDSNGKDSKNNSPKMSSNNSYRATLLRKKLKHANPNPRRSLPTSENNNSSNTNTQDQNSIYIQNLQEFHITNAEDGIRLLQKGLKHRQVASTKMNDFSSRSHTIFTITLYKNHQGDLFRLSKMNLVDLAGSENISRSGALNQRAKEAGSINQSLLTLGRVINSLADKNVHIPFRESKLTRLLQDSLGGNTKTALIATISPAKMTSEETCSTLEYASKAKNIKNKPQLGSIIMKDILLKNVTTELSKLKSDLLSTKSKDGIFMSQEHYKELTQDMENYKTELQESKRVIESLKSQCNNLTKEKVSSRNEFESQQLKISSLNESIGNLHGTLQEKTNLENNLQKNICNLEHNSNMLQEKIKFFKDRELSINSKFKLLLNDQLVILQDKLISQLKIFQTDRINENFNLDSNLDVLKIEMINLLKSMETTLRDSYKSCIDEFLKDTPTLFKSIDDNVTNVQKMATNYYNQLAENLSDISEEYNNLKQYLNDEFFQNNHQDLLHSYINQTSQIMENSSDQLLSNVKDMISTYLESNKQLIKDSMKKSTNEIIEQELKFLKPKKEKWESSIGLINNCDSINNAHFTSMNSSINDIKIKITKSNKSMNESIVKINDSFSNKNHKEVETQIMENKLINNNFEDIIKKSDSLKQYFKKSMILSKDSIQEINGLDNSIKTILHDIDHTEETSKEETLVLQAAESPSKKKLPLGVSTTVNLNEQEPTDNNKKRKVIQHQVNEDERQSKIPRI